MEGGAVWSPNDRNAVPADRLSPSRFNTAVAGGPCLLSTGVSAQFLRRPLLADNPHLHSLRHLAEWAPQYVCNPPKTADRRIDDSALYPADVRPVEAAVGAEAFLREASLITEFAHDDTDGFCLEIGRLDLPLLSAKASTRVVRNVAAPISISPSNSATGASFSAKRTFLYSPIDRATAAWLRRTATWQRVACR
jgi:hypothetical protein